MQIEMAGKAYQFLHESNTRRMHVICDDTILGTLYTDGIRDMVRCSGLSIAVLVEAAEYYKKCYREEVLNING